MDWASAVPAKPWYVARKDLASNTLYVVQGENHPALFSHGLEAGDLRWVAGAPPTLPLRCAAKTRYHQPDQACALTLSPAHWPPASTCRGARLRRGQSVVFYQGGECLGGGVIQRALAAVDASPPDSLAAR